MKKQEIIVRRTRQSRWGIDGCLSIGGNMFCHTVEHPEMHLPKGRYVVRILKSRQLNRLTPTLMAANGDMPIMMPANGAMAVRDGSIVVGNRLIEGVVVKTDEVFAKLVDRLDKAQRRGVEITLEIV